MWFRMILKKYPPYADPNVKNMFQLNLIHVNSKFPHYKYAVAAATIIERKTATTDVEELENAAHFTAMASSTVKLAFFP